MGHNIYYNEQIEKHSFFSVKEKAWHNLGQIVEDYPNSAEAIRHAGLDYEVEKKKVIYSCIGRYHHRSSELFQYHTHRQPYGIGCCG